MTEYLILNKTRYEAYRPIIMFGISNLEQIQASPSYCKGTTFYLNEHVWR